VTRSAQAAAKAPRKSEAAPVRVWGNAVPTIAERADLKRNSIIREAAASFNRGGFHGTSMDDIASRLGVTKAALYRYVSSKHDLLFACFNLAIDSGIAGLERGEREGKDGLDKLRIAVRVYLEDLMGKLGHPAVLLEDGALLPHQMRAIIRRRDEAEKRYRKLVEEGIADGSVMPCNPKLAVFAVLGVVNWVPKWYRADGELSASEIVDSLVSLTTNGIAAQHKRLALQPPVEGGPRRLSNAK
jgi:TetR/AcrR family transcriptional regulator